MLAKFATKNLKFGEFLETPHRKCFRIFTILKVEYVQVLRESKKWKVKAYKYQYLIQKSFL